MDVFKTVDPAGSARRATGPLRLLATALAACGWVVLAAAAVEAAELKLRAECRCAGPVVTLGDVADVVTADPEQAEALAAVELFPSPPPGERRFVRLRQIQDLLLLRGIHLVDHHFSGATQVAIVAETRRLDRKVRQSTTPRVANHAESDAPEAVVVAARSLPRGAVIGASDVRLADQRDADVHGEPFHAIQHVLGQETTRAVVAGKALTATSVRPPVLVRRGEVVSVFVRSPGIRIRSTARARDEGSLGDLIAVESFEDRKTFLARVSGIQEVEVYARAMRSRPAASDFTLSSGMGPADK